MADEELIWRAHMIKELVMVRDGVCCLTSDEFFKDDVLALIFICLLADFLKFFLYTCFIVCLCVYFEYDLQ